MYNKNEQKKIKVNKINSNEANNNNKKTIIKTKIKIGIILTLSVLILAITLITLFCTTVESNLSFLNYKFYIMESQSQSYIAQKGDLVIVKKNKPNEIEKGDHIVYKDKNIYYCDNIVETKKINTLNKMVIAEKEGVRYQFSEDEIEGKIVCKISKVGNIINFLRTPIGILLFAVFVVCIFILLRILLVK